MKGQLKVSQTSHAGNEGVAKPAELIMCPSAACEQPEAGGVPETLNVNVAFLADPKSRQTQADHNNT